MGNCEIKVKRSCDELYHSDTFLGNEFDDEMYHYKYIKKYKVNGKWRYYYDTRELRKFDKEATDTTKITKDGATFEKTTEYRKSDKLFSPGDRTYKFTMSPLSGGGSSHSSVTTTKYQGKAARAYAKAEKKIYDTFYNSERKTQRVNSLKKKAAKAKEKIKSWLKIR